MPEEHPKEIKVLEADHDDMMALMNRKRGINEAIRNLSEEALAATNHELDELWDGWAAGYRIDLERFLYAYNHRKRAIVRIRSTKRAMRERVDAEIRKRADALVDEASGKGAEMNLETVPIDPPPEKSGR